MNLLLKQSNLVGFLTRQPSDSNVVMICIRQLCYSCSPYALAIPSDLFIILYPYLVPILVTYFKILTIVWTSLPNIIAPKYGAEF
jgi:hypothetical protein